MSTTLTKVRMLKDHPPGAEGAAVLFHQGTVRTVDSERCARLVADRTAEELPADWQPEAAGEPAPLPTTTRPPRRVPPAKKGG